MLWFRESQVNRLTFFGVLAINVDQKKRKEKTREKTNAYRLDV